MLVDLWERELPVLVQAGNLSSQGEPEHLSHGIPPLSFGLYCAFEADESVAPAVPGCLLEVLVAGLEAWVQLGEVDPWIAEEGVEHAHRGEVVLESALQGLGLLLLQSLQVGLGGVLEQVADASRRVVLSRAGHVALESDELPVDAVAWNLGLVLYVD